MNLITNVFNKKTLLLGSFLSLSALSFAQGVGINDNGTPPLPHTSAMLDVKSTTKGVLIPRVTSTQRTAIVSPATSLLVFDTDNNNFWFYNGTAWTELVSTIDELNTNATLNGNMLEITDAGGTFSIDLSNFLDNTDAQNLSLSGNLLTIDNGNTIDLSTIGTGSDNQTLSLSGTDLTISDGNTISLSDFQNQSTFEVNNGVVRSNSSVVDETSDDFVFGSTQLDNDGNSNHDNRFFFDKSKGAFRVGEAGGTEWNSSSLGTNSMAWGEDTKASSNRSTAWGYRTKASGINSTAWGEDTEASSSHSTAWGDYTTASGSNATVWGNYVTASGTNSTAWGYYTQATGNYSTAWGERNFASGKNATSWGDGAKAFGDKSTAWGDNSVAFGENTTVWGENNSASGENSTVWGEENEASGKNSTAWGRYVMANSYLETSLGQYNTYENAYGPSSWDSRDRLFVIGNGTSSSSRSDALAVYKNGNVEVPGNIYFGTEGAFLSSNNQGGSMELGPSSSSGGEIPFIDFHYGLGPSQDYNARIINDGNNQLSFVTNSGTAMTIKNTKVGIGTTSPTNGKLEVSGGVNKSFLSDYTYLTAGGDKRTYSGGTENVSIYADGFIAGHRCISHSDRRIKTNLEKSNSQKDLETLMAVQVTDYQFIDKAVNGDRTEKKVIAQELKEIYPQAVVDGLTQVVPDIMQFAPAKEGWVSLEKHNLKVGETVRLVHQAGANEFEVLEVNTNAFKVAFEEDEKLLVYGRQVNDFHTVDYDAVAMLNVSATQAQQQLIETLQKEVEDLRKQNLSLNSYKASTEARLEKLEALLGQNTPSSHSSTASK